ncbi:hypothetical protein [Streptomyces graminofaciens]|nr:MULTISPECIES: hypothetical protein [Streptomyces]WLW58715.1 hypothetical protein QU709_38890 [Streptomyces coralus]
MERRYEYSFDRPNWFEQSAAEHRAVREGVGVIDTSSFGKLLVQGHDAVRVLQRVSVNDLYTEPGRITYTQWLNEHGGIESDVTITRLTEDRFLVLSGGAESETECMCVCPSLPTYRPAPADPRTAPFGKSASRPTSSNGSLGR